MVLNSNLFSGKQFVLDLNFAVSSKHKNELRDKITKHDGVISYIVSKKCNYVVVLKEASNQEENTESFKIKTARKYNLPVVREDYVDACLESGCLLNYEEYEISETKQSEEEKTSWLNEGKINLSTIETTYASKPKFSKKSARVWKYKDESGPNFHEKDYKIIKVHFCKGKKKSLGHPFCVLELHVLREQSTSDDEFRFCVFTHRGYLPVNNKQNETKECRYFTSAVDGLSAYVQLWRQFTSPPQSMQKVIRLNKLNFELGSDQLKLDKWITTRPLVDDRVHSLVQMIWAEAERELDETLEVHWTKIAIDKVEEAVGLLLTIMRQTSSIEISSKEFFELIPYKQKVDLGERRNLIAAINLCQLIKDSIRVSEMTSDGSVSVDFKYNALRCRIEHVSPNEDDYQDICKRMAGADIIVKNMFRIYRDSEDDDFASSVGNNRLLFHATNTKNFVGILSRGLLLPYSKQPDTSLGAGIYFADNVCALKELITPNFTRKTRLVFVHQVALGNCYEAYEKNPHLLQPPDNYNSVHGVRNGEDSFSQFYFDEYVIYDRSQQRIRYIIEFYLPDEEINFREDKIKESKEKDTLDDEDEITDELTDTAVVETDELMHMTKPSTHPSKIGLQPVRGDAKVELKSVSVHGCLFDLTAEVVILQEYVNDSSATIEAKYVFPVDEMAAVCGFEAFLNGRHIVGRMEEKQTARQQYEEAVRQGKSALLMDQATPDVFTITIGNILPKSSVLVKITYVTELELEGDLISFRLPGTISPSQPEQSSSTVTSSEVKTSLELSLEMPYDIRLVTSSTHRIRVKKTATMATVQLVNDQQLSGCGFQLLVGLAEIHCPRMLTEDGENGTQACMLTFYPEFNCRNENEIQVILVMDSSNSMREGNAFLTAQKVALLCLQKLPSQCLFNVVSFGSTYEEFYPDCIPYNLEFVHEASKFISKQTPSKGDSVARNLLESIFILSRGNAMKNVILISDGYLNDDYDILLSTVRNNCNDKGLTRIFTLAVGQVPNRHAMRGLARAGAGTFALFDDYSECWAWTEKIERVMAHTQAPAVADISVEWQMFDETGCQPLVQAPRNITTLFNGSRLVVYGLLVGASTLMAELTARIPGGDQVRTVVSPYNSSTSRGKTIHRLATRAVVRDWEHGTLNTDRSEHEVMKRTLKPELIQLSKFYSIVTPFTSFIAVDDQNDISSHLKISIEELVARESVDQLSYLEYDYVKKDNEKSDDFCKDEAEKGIESCVDFSLNRVVQELSEEPITMKSSKCRFRKRQQQQQQQAQVDTVIFPEKPTALDRALDLRQMKMGFSAANLIPQSSPGSFNFGAAFSSKPSGPLCFGAAASTTSTGAANVVPQSSPGSFNFGATISTGASGPFCFGAPAATTASGAAYPNAFGSTVSRGMPSTGVFGNAPAKLFMRPAKLFVPQSVAPPAPPVPSGSMESTLMTESLNNLPQTSSLGHSQLSHKCFVPLRINAANSRFSEAQCDFDGFMVDECSEPIELTEDSDCLLDATFNDSPSTMSCEQTKQARIRIPKCLDEDIICVKKKKKKHVAKFPTSQAENIFFQGAWVQLDDGCVSFGDGMPFCFTFYKASFARRGQDFIPPSRLNKTIFGHEPNVYHIKNLNEDFYQSFEGVASFVEFARAERDWNEQLWNEIVEQLETKGLNSLPQSSRDAVYGMITMLGAVFVAIKRFSCGCLPLRLSILREIQEAVDDFIEALQDDEIVGKVYCAMACLVYYNHKHPMLYRTLQLGNCWEEAFERLTHGQSLILED